MNHPINRLLTAVMPAVAITPVLRWLILTHSVEPDQPWRTRCHCGHPLWPSACGPAGRCRSCGNRPGPPGYLIEAVAITAALAAVLPAQGTWQAAAALWWTAGVVVLASVDAYVRRLPHRVTAATAAGYIGLLAVAGDATALARAVVGATLAVAAFTVAAMARPGHLGWGDIGFAAPLSAFLAAHSWTALMHGYLAGFGAAVAFLALTRMIRRSSRTIPLGPFLVAGALIATQL